MAGRKTLVDGIVEETLAVFSPPSPALDTGVRLGVIGQTAVTVAGTVANQAEGTVALPAIASGAVGTIVIGNTLIRATSVLLGQVARRLAGDGGTVPAAGVQGGLSWNEVSRVPGTSITIEIRNNGAAASLLTDFIFNYIIFN